MFSFDQAQTLDRIISLVELKRKPGKPLRIAIDGRSASGKTTLAAALQDKLGLQLIHMDDFYLRKEQRTEERLQEAGGNVDRERFIEQIVTPLVKGHNAVYQRLDCSDFKIEEVGSISASKDLLVEGSYTCHPAIYGFFDLILFLDIDPQTQKERILRRETSEKANMFLSRWIPLEEKYFNTYSIRELADLVI